MPVVIVPGTAYATERLKWEYQEFAIGEERGQRGPRVHEEFPKMVYKAGRNADNQIDLIDQAIAGDEDELRKLISRGFVDGPAQAVAKAEAQEREIAKLAANRAFLDRRMSPEAQAEAQAYEDATPGHVAEIPVAPKKRGRPKKIDAA